MDHDLINLCNVTMALTSGVIAALVSARTIWKLGLAWGLNLKEHRNDLEILSLLASIFSLIVGVLASLGTFDFCGEFYGLVEFALTAPLCCAFWIAIALCSKIYERILDGINVTM